MKAFATVVLLVGLSTVAISRSTELTLVFSFGIGDVSDIGQSLAVDARGSSYVFGSRTDSTRPFPITNGAVQTRPAAMFIAKVDERGDRIIWATYLGGSRNRNANWRGLLDSPVGIATDPAGNVFVTGNTAAADFPVENAAVASAQPTGSEGFLTKRRGCARRLDLFRQRR